MIADDLDDLDEQQLRQLLRNVQQELSGAKQTIAFKQAFIDKITHENAIPKRLKFAAKSETLNAEQRTLLDETLDTDLAAVAAEIEQLPPQPKTGGDKQQARRQALPAHCRAATCTTSPRRPAAAAASRLSASAKTSA